jgi:16S rRNA pseudouridine516 synthase
MKKNIKRLDQILANCGYCSRSEAGQCIKNGVVCVNGTVIKDKAFKADPGDVFIDGQPIDHPHGLLAILYKPQGYVCSHDSSEGLRIYDLLPQQWNRRNPGPESIGRLDKDTTGIILITDLPNLVHDLGSPKKHVEKTYEVTVDKQLEKSLIPAFSSGTLLLEDETSPCLPAQLLIHSSSSATVKLKEGKYHQVKRMFKAFGYTVQSLHRSKFGNLTLERIEPGKTLDITEQFLSGSLVI